jgi:hypothetical protein
MAEQGEMSSGVKVAWISLAGTVLAAVIAGTFGVIHPKTNQPDTPKTSQPVMSQGPAEPQHGEQSGGSSPSVAPGSAPGSDRQPRAATPRRVPAPSVPAPSVARVLQANSGVEPKLPDWLMKYPIWLFEILPGVSTDSQGCSTYHGVTWILTPRKATLAHEDSSGSRQIPGAPCHAWSHCFFHYKVAFRVSADGTSVGVQADSPSSYMDEGDLAPTCQERGFHEPFSGVITKASDNLIHISWQQGPAVDLGEVTLSGKY